MALSIGNSVHFTNEVVAAGAVKKIVDLNLYNVLPPQSTTQTPAGLQSGKDDSTNYLVFPWKNPGQPGNGLGVDLIVQFGPTSLAGATNALAAYNAILAATTAI